MQYDPALGEAAQICIAAHGHTFRVRNARLLKDLAEHMNAHNTAHCWALCDELMNSAEFRAWAREQRY